MSYPLGDADHPSLVCQAAALSHAFHAYRIVLVEPRRAVVANLTVKQIRRGSFRSTRQLEAAITGYLRVYNENPKPFVWTKTADEFLQSLARSCARISGTGH